MIYIFAPDATPTDLLTNGYGILECSSCSVYEELNGEFSCFVSIPLDTKNEEYFVGDAIVKVPTHRGVQYFRLQVPETQLTGKTATGYHISYDMSNDLILNGYVAAGSGNTALTYILSNGTYETRFSGTSDIATINNARIVRTPLLSALMDGGRENSFVSRWGGEIERDNFTFNINTRLGADNGARVSYKKNLSGLRITEDYTKIATRIYPTCLKADDTVLAYSGSGYIDSPELSTYPMPKIKHIHYSDIKVGAEVDGSILYPDEASAIAEMLARVQALYAAGQDKPQVTVEASVANLPEYAELNLGDTVKGGFRDWVFNHRVVSVNYDGLYDRMISVTLGTVKSSFQGTMYAQTAQVQAISDSLEGVVYQGEKYNEVYIDHTDGFVAECSALNVRMVSNAGTIGFYDMTTDEFIGGLAVRDGKVSLLTDSVG
ncbi:MAG: phage tail protein, partial [Candidatus Marinimicrobia bacterium]|nr:phage tail protein [Candidatus Neomarinimicrobiota bacterium]